MVVHHVNRQHERHAADITIELILLPQSREQVAPTGGKSMAGHVTDLSEGGAGVVTQTFLPRGTQVEFRVPGDGDTSTEGLAARVMRVSMVDREPHYAVGLRFEDPDKDTLGRLSELLLRPKEESE